MLCSCSTTGSHYSLYAYTVQLGVSPAWSQTAVLATHTESPSDEAHLHREKVGIHTPQSLSSSLPTLEDAHLQVVSFTAHIRADTSLCLREEERWAALRK